ncbi:MAG: hypothetical protein AAFW98_03235, partial [Pseudomonadota bacterium]
MDLALQPGNRPLTVLSDTPRTTAARVTHQAGGGVRRALGTALLATPLTLWLAIGFAVPMATVVLLSLQNDTNI